MIRLLCGALICALAPMHAFAKPGDSCASLLTLTRATLEEFSILPLAANEYVFVLFAHHPAVSEVAESIRARVGQRVATTVVRDPEGLRGKRDLADFEQAAFALVDGLESFVLNEVGAPVIEHVELLRALLLKRVAGRRPTLIVVRDPASANRYLLRLTNGSKRTRDRAD